MTKYFHNSFVVCPTDEYYFPVADFFILIVFPNLRKLSSLRGTLYSCSSALAMCIDVSGRLILQCLKRRMLKACPYLLLPFAVVAFYGILKPVLPYWRKYCHYSKTQTGSDDSPDDIGVLMRAGESGVVVELCIIRQSEFAPVTKNCFQSQFCVPPRFGPAFYQTSMQGDCVEYFNLSLATNEETFDEIELIQFSKPFCDKRQVPTQSGGLATQAPTIISCAVSLKDVANSPQGRSRLDTAPFKFVKYGLSAEFSQHTLVTKLFANSEDQFLRLWAGSVMNPPRCALEIAETDAIKPLVSRSINPTFDIGWRNAKLASDRANRLAATNGSNYCVPPFFEAVFLFNVSASRISFLT